MARLQLQSVSKSFRGRTGVVSALADFSLAVEPGAFVLVKGPSGSGKSTLLFLAGALLTPTAGQVLFEDQDVGALGAGGRAALRQSAIGFVFQSFHLVPYLTAEENIALAGPGPVGEHLERFGLLQRRGHLPSQLSVGERQRVALLRALLPKPRLVLADEPTGNLDAENCAIVSHALRSHCHSGGSVVMATHSDAYDAVADRIVRLSQGREVAASR